MISGLETTIAFWILSGTLAVYGLYKLLRIGSRDKRLPPGPPTIPILGNLQEIPLTGFHEKIKEWADQYGSVYSLKLGNATMIILNDRKSVHDLIDKKSSIYSARPFDYISEIAMGTHNILFTSTTPLWRAQRKVAARTLSPQQLDSKVAPIQEAEISQLLFDLLETPEEFYDHMRRTTASIASIVNFGHRGPTFESFWANAVYRSMDKVNPTVELGANPPIEQFPILKYIPDRWAPWVHRAKDTYECFESIWSEALGRVEERRKANDIRISIADTILGEKQQLDFKMSRHNMLTFLGTMQQGGADSVASAMIVTILYLAQHPEIQARAQKELDEVCGDSRIPNWTDFERLPYINCIVKEGLRIHPPAPAGAPHRVECDDWYEGMLIPKDATIIVPAWSLHHSIYEDPDTYNPDRFLDRPLLAMNYAGSPDYMSRDHYAYGAGRRICPGIHLAERTQWRIVAKMLWAFDIKPTIDPETNAIYDLTSVGYVNGIVRYPKPFKVEIKPRSPAHEKTIRESFEGAREFLKTWE